MAQGTKPRVIFYIRSDQFAPIEKGEMIERAITQHKGWQSVTVGGRRYQLFGGIRTPFFITLSNPIPRRKDK